MNKQYRGITFWPFIVVQSRHLKEDAVFMNHEKIHLQQQIEMLVIPFYLWYGIAFLLRWWRYRNWDKAYMNISFEREAYANEKDLHYLQSRSFWKFWNYIK